MRKIALAAAVAAAAIAVPAQANEGRAEARGGIVWANGVEEAVAGVALGYDFDLSQQNDGGVFIGVEASADHVLASGADFVWGVGGRLGANVGPDGKLYAAGGYAFGDGEDVPYLGAGYSHKVGKAVYISGEYRHFFSDFVDVNAVTIGIGANF